MNLKMASANVSRLGQVNQADDVRALFLKIFTGEVLQAFDDKNLFLDKTQVRTITQGKSASFALVGNIGAEYHTPGTEIQGQKVNHGEKVISIDDLLISHSFISDIDEAMNHYDVRAPYSKEMGRKLADEMDRNIANEIIKGARSEAVLDDGVGGSQIFDTDMMSATFDTKIQALAKALFTSAQTMDEKDIPEDRYVAFRPAEYYALAQNLDLINKDYGGQGAIADGNVIKVAGIQVLKHNKVPNSDTSSNTYHGVNASNTVGVVWNPTAVGTVKLLDLALRADYDPRRLGTLMVAKYACGHGVVRPESAIELATEAIV
jgi:hypothetical protein